MNTQTNQPQSLKQYIKWLQQAVDKGHLYNCEEYAKIKKELYQAKQLRKLVQAKERSAYGFGYIYEDITSQTNISDSRSGENDGVCSEGEQPSEPGESQCSETA